MGSSTHGFALQPQANDKKGKAAIMATITQPQVTRLERVPFLSGLRNSFLGAAFNGRFIFSLTVFVLVAGFGFLGPALLGRDDPFITVGGLYDSPSADAWLGTDNFGRDVFTQLM